MPADLTADLHSLLSAIDVEQLRFLTADRYRAYAAILWILLERRRGHEIEVYYDDLMMEALQVVPGVEPGSYSPDDFRSDIRQLEDWGNLAPRRLEPRRIETLADRNLQKFLCRIDDDTVAILEFLISRVLAGAAVLSDRGRHLLQDAAERLNEAWKLARKTARNRDETAVQDDDLRRLSYLCIEVDHKVDGAAQELAAFHAALVEFSVNPFRLEALSEVIERLERYVEDYISEATGRARLLQRTASRMSRAPLAHVLARSREQVERRIHDDPLLMVSATPVPDVLHIVGKLIPFFAPGGRFDILLERVHASARDVVRRVHKHVENVRARNIRMETLRDRTREMSSLGETDLAEANAWINRLFASAHLVSDLRSGTPGQRSSLPRPARRYQSRRSAQQGECLADKRGIPGQSRALERLRLLRLGRFIEEKILRGASKALLDTAALDGYEDFRLLLDAVKAHGVRSGKMRKLLSYGIDRPAGNGAGELRAKFSTDSGTLDAPDLIFKRAGGGDHA
jgi:hypothetical protein